LTTDVVTDQRRRSGGLETLALIAADGFLGSLAHYGVATLVSGPAGTFLANVTGSAAERRVTARQSVPQSFEPCSLPIPPGI
jgi:fluoride ion exporter CrcB/FEX